MGRYRTIERPWLYVDSSRKTHVIVCERCGLNFGPFLSGRVAQNERSAHVKTHRGDAD